MRLCHDIVYLQFVALLAFSTTAGFSTVNPDDNHVNCIGFNNTAYKAGLNFQYPMDSQDFFFSYLPFPPPNATENGCPQSMPFQSFNGRSGYFVAMGVLSMIYVIVAIVVYMLFLIPDLFLVKWLVIGVSKKLCDSSEEPLALYLYLPLLSLLLFLPLPLPSFLSSSSSPILLLPFSLPFSHSPSFLSSSSPLLLPLSFPSLLSFSSLSSLFFTGLHCHDSIWCTLSDGRHFMVYRCCRFTQICGTCTSRCGRELPWVQPYYRGEWNQSADICPASHLFGTCMLLLKGKRMQ